MYDVALLFRVLCILGIYKLIKNSISAGIKLNIYSMFCDVHVFYENSRRLSQALKTWLNATIGR